MHREDSKPWRYLNIPGAPKRFVSPKKVMRRMSLTASGRLVERLNSGATQLAGFIYEKEEEEEEVEEEEEEVVEVVEEKGINNFVHDRQSLRQRQERGTEVVSKKEEKKEERKMKEKRKIRKEERKMSRTSATATTTTIHPSLLNATYIKSLKLLSKHEERDMMMVSCCCFQKMIV